MAVTVAAVTVAEGLVVVRTEAGATATAATAAATAEEFVHHHQPQSYHARGTNIPFGFPLTPMSFCCSFVAFVSNI